MALVAICDFCDKKMNLGERKDVSVILHEQVDRQLANLDLCDGCLKGLTTHIINMKTTRSGD